MLLLPLTAGINKSKSSLSCNVNDDKGVTVIDVDSLEIDSSSCSCLKFFKNIILFLFSPVLGSVSSLVISSKPSGKNGEVDRQS